MTASKPYFDSTHGEWVGEFETRSSDGEVSRQTEWFATEAEARRFADTGTKLRYAFGELTPEAQQTALETIAALRKAMHDAIDAAVSGTHLAEFKEIDSENSARDVIDANETQFNQDGSLFNG